MTVNYRILLLSSKVVLFWEAFEFIVKLNNQLLAETAETGVIISRLYEQ